MAIRPEQQLLHYRLIERIGKGGMGEVWRAQDTKLDRDVAIKVLPDSMARDKERILRFEREAKLLATLNHPHIAAIYGFEESDGKRFLVLELVEGETLGECLKREPLPVGESLEVAKQIAEALEAAHEKGIIHRDLKPANIKVTPNGTVKVLDFGLARAMADDSGNVVTAADSPTITADYTKPGVVLGTAPYMSPEQARGRPLDKRTDIWSFGVILYECLTGSMLFHGETASDSMGAIMHRDPDWTALPADTPPVVQLLLRRCLTKDPKKRLHDIADARLELEEAIADPTSSSLALASAAMLGAGHAGKRGVLGRAAVWILGIALGATGMWFVVSGGVTSDSDAMQMQFEIPLRLPETADSSPLAPVRVVIAADGSAVVIEVAGAGQPLYVREMNSLETRVLVGTEGGTRPFISPDGRWIGYQQKERLMRIPREGGMPIPICKTGPEMSDAAWLDDGTIVATFISTISTVFGVSASGGELGRLWSNESRPDLLGFETICRVPGQRYVLVGAFTGNAVEADTIAAVSLDDGSIETIIPNGGDPAITADGHLVYVRGSSLYAVRFDLEDHKVLGPETRVLDSIATQQWGGEGYYALSPNGTLAYVPGKRFSLGRRLAWVDRTGGVDPLPIDPDAFVPDLSLSADGKHVAFNTLRQGLELWAYDLNRKTRRSLSTEGECYNPVWEIVGRRLAYSRRTVSAGYLNTEIIVHDLSNGSTQTLPLDPHDQSPYSWLPDGKGLLIGRRKPDPSHRTDWDILAYRFGEEEPLETILATEHSERSPVLSHNGSWLAYVSDENGRDQVFLRAYPDDSRKWQVSFSGVRDTWIAWAPDDSELYWIADDHLVAAAIKTEPAFEIGAPEKLFVSPWPLAADRWAAIDVAPDGRFLMIQPAEWENQVRHVRIALNWDKELQRLTKHGD